MTMSLRNARLLIPLVTLLAALLLPACEQGQPSIPAPVDDYAVLEKLAAAYEQIARDYPVQVRGMRPAGRKEFVRRVFQAAGYDYSASLLALAGPDVDTAGQNYRDLAELLLLPHQGLDEEAREDLYSHEELEAIHAIEAHLR